MNGLRAWLDDVIEWAQAKLQLLSHAAMDMNKWRLTVEVALNI